MSKVNCKFICQFFNRQNFKMLNCSARQKQIIAEKSNAIDFEIGRCTNKCVHFSVQKLLNFALRHAYVVDGWIWINVTVCFIGWVMSGSKTADFGVT